MSARRAELRDIVDRSTGARFDYGPFREACSRAARPGGLLEFRRDPAILQVVECVSPDEGLVYARAIERCFPRRWFAVACLANDRVGHPETVTYGGAALAPATWRYAFRALELSATVGPLGGLSVVEIGGGYGGLAATMAQLEPAGAYAIVDAPEPGAMQAAYLRSLGVGGVQTASVLPAEPLAPDLVVSDFALSELDEDVRAAYGEALVRGARAGAFCWNEHGGLSANQGAAWLSGVTGRRVFRASERPALAASGLGLERLEGRLYFREDD